MTSFSIPDSPTRVDLKKDEAPSVNLRTGSVSFTVRNTSEAQKAARLRIETDDAAEDEWFSFSDAPKTSPRFLERDFAGESSQTIDVSIKALGRAEDLLCKFRLFATAEDDPDNDFVEGPWVTVAVPSFRVILPPPPKPKWWKIAIGVVLALIASVVLWKILFGVQEPPPPVSGETQAVAVERLRGAGFERVKVENAKKPEGEEPGYALRAVAFHDGEEGEGEYDIKLLLDPGVTIPDDLVGELAHTVMERLINLGLIPKPRRSRTGVDGDPELLVVKSIDPQSPVRVALGDDVVLRFKDLKKDDLELWEQMTLTGAAYGLFNDRNQRAYIAARSYLGAYKTNNSEFQLFLQAHPQIIIQNEN